MGAQLTSLHERSCPGKSEALGMTAVSVSVPWGRWCWMDRSTSAVATMATLLSALWRPTHLRQTSKESSSPGALELARHSMKIRTALITRLEVKEGLSYLAPVVCVGCSVASDSLQPHKTIALQAPLSMKFSRQEYWSGLLFPSPGYLPNPGIKAQSPALQADSLLSEPPGKFSTCTSLHVIGNRYLTTFD